jgi:hypothetical protein
MRSTNPLLKIVHLLALGCWLGAVVFFSFFTALPIIRHMEELATKESNWPGFTEKEQGTRAAGEALQAVFIRYFPFQLGCGTLAAVTALAWLRLKGRAHKLRFAVILVGVLLVTVNTFFLAPKVGELRSQRYQLDRQKREDARQAFGTWHTYSLGTDMAGLLCAGIGMVLAAFLPARSPSDGA